MTKEQAEFLYSIADNMGTIGIEYFTCKDGEKMREIIKELEQQTINCNAITEEIAQSFIDDVKTVKDYLPKCTSMEFPATFEEYAKDYGFIDDKEIYTNGSHLIPVFRVRQWLEHLCRL